MKNDLISRSALLNSLKDINETDYGSMSDYRAHMAVGNALRDVCRVVDAAPPVATEPKWISVEERLPEDDEHYMVWCSDNNSFEVALYFGDGEWVTEDIENITRVVTHWMPLPEPPKDGGAEG